MLLKFLFGFPLSLSWGASCGDLVKHIETNFIGAKVATFAADQFEKVFESELRSAGTDLIIIRKPSVRDQNSFSEKDGYFLKPERVAWKLKSSSPEDYLAALNSKERGRFKTKLKKSESKILTEIAPLTLEDYAKWFEIYQGLIQGKDRGRLAVDADWAKEKGAELGKYRRIFFREALTGKLLGGVLLRGRKRYSRLQAPYAAFAESARELELPFRSFFEILKYAQTKGFCEINYGMDTNLYGHHLSIGLMEYKSSLGFKPETTGENEIIKVLNPEILNQDYYFFALDPLGALRGEHFARVPRTLKTPADTPSHFHSLAD